MTIPNMYINRQHGKGDFVYIDVKFFSMTENGNTMKFAAVFALMLAQPAFANGLDDLKTALGALQGAGALRGSYEVKENRTDLDAKPPKAESGAATAQVEDDVNGLAIRWDQSLVKRVVDESFASKDKTKKLGASQMLSQISAERVSKAVNYAPNLMQTLNNAQLRGERMDAWNGKPARMIEVNISVPGPEDGKVSMKENSHIAKIWLGGDNLPLAASVSHTIKGSFMVLLSFEQKSKEDMTFSVVNNRLVLLKSDDAGKIKAPGTDSEYRRVSTFTPKA
jgi:hypothetical protein